MFRLEDALRLGPWEEGLLPVATMSLQFLDGGPGGDRPQTKPREVQIGVGKRVA